MSVLTFDQDGDGVRVDLEALVASRLLVQGSSGAGKSYLIRYLLEQTHGRIQQFVFDPEGEFSTLRERFDYVVASAGGDGDVPAHPDSADLLCRQLVELEASAILDIYELEPADRERFVANFLHRLVNLPKSSWRPALVVVDEAHEFAPERGDAPSRKPMELVVSKGRKRGLCAVYSTQRLSKLSKNASDLQNVLIGYTGLDVDVRRAADILGLDRAGSQQLKQLDHEFLAFGPAFGREVLRVRSGRVQTHHPKAGELRAPTPPPRGKLAALVAELAAIPERAREEVRTLETLATRVRELERELAAARRAGGDVVGRQEAEAKSRRLLEELAAARTAAEGAREELTRVRAVLRAHVSKLDETAAEGERVRAMIRATLANSDATTQRVAPRLEHVPATTKHPPEHKPAPRPDLSTTVQEPQAIAPRHQRILDALARLEAMGIATPSRSILAAVAGTSPKSSTFENAVSRLSSLELVRYPGAGTVELTEEGRYQAAEPARAVTLEEVHAAWFALLEPRHRRLLEVLIAVYPDALSREELAARADQSAASSTFENAVSRLSSFGVVRYPRRGEVVATELLFPPQLSR